MDLEMVEFYKANDRMPYYKLNQEFHSRLTELSKNATLQEMQRNIQARLKRIRYIGNENPTAWAGAVRDHEAMIEALRAKDGPQIRPGGRGPKDWARPWQNTSGTLGTASKTAFDTPDTAARILFLSGSLRAWASRTALVATPCSRLPGQKAWRT